MSNTPRWYFGPLENNQWRGCRLDPKNRGENFSSGFLHSDFFGGGMSRYGATPVTVALSLGHSDIIMFRPWSPIATGNHLNRAEKNPKLPRRLAPLSFWSAFRYFGTHFAESFHMFKSSWMMDPTRSREMPGCSAIGLPAIRRSSKISSWLWSIISGMVTVLGRPGRGASQVEKLPRLNWATQFLTVEYDGARYPNVSVRMAWISFCALLCRGKKT